MTRRRLYQFVADVLPEAGGVRPLLAACADAMRLVRGLPSPRDALAARLLGDDAFASVLAQDEALGQIYQAVNAPALESAYRAARRDRRKFTGADVPAVTQLFTPRWVVEFLLHNTLGRLWLEMHPDSRIGLPWLVERPTVVRAVRPALGLTVLDPACGTMNFGLVAVELLGRMYREELDRAGRSGWLAEPSVVSADRIPSSIVRHNLFGIDIDPLALELAAATLEMKLGRAPPNLRCADALFAELPGHFDVVVTNPPYLSARNLPGDVVKRMRLAYPAGWRDACACFIERMPALLRESGRVGVLAMQSFMFTGSFQRLRERLDETMAVETIAHFGGGLFDVGNPGTLQTAAVVMRREPDAEARAGQIVNALRLTDVEDKRIALRDRHGLHRIEQRELNASPRRAWTYWLSRDLREVFAKHPPLARVAPPRQGLATTDNARFVRYWWEVASAERDKWLPYAKAGRFRRWHEAPRRRVDWADDGAAVKRSIVERYPYLGGKWAWVAKNAAYYGRAGVTYSYLTSGRFSARRLDAGAIFDVAGSALFPDDALTMLGVLNSSTARRLLDAINPTVNFQVGDLAQLPVPPARNDALRHRVARAIELRRTLDTFDETSLDFVAPTPWLAAEGVWRDITGELASLERQIDLLVARLYDLSGPEPDPRTDDPFDRVDLARRWTSFALRASSGESIWRLRPIDPRLLARVRDAIATLDGPSALEQIEQTLGGLDRFLERDFFAWHVSLYARRPVMWVLGDRQSDWLVANGTATRETVGYVLAELRSRTPRGWDRFVDDGVLVNLAPLRRWVRDRRLGVALEKVARDAGVGRYAWSETYRRAALTPAPTRGSASSARRSRSPTSACRGAGRAGR